MDPYADLLRPLLFRLDPERAHGWAMRAARLRLGGGPASLPKQALGLDFPNPIGLAAGFDKDGENLAAWPRFGFGFVEVGTVTPRPQGGNPKPRLFRLPADRALVNRMGFNNAGSAALARRLERTDRRVPIGINLGKNRDTPPERAAEDYAAAFRDLHRLGDYFVVNVSSPNTPGLRTLQEADALRRIVGGMKEVDESPPILVKVSPDEDDASLDGIVAVVHEFALAGVVATNTTVSRSGLHDDPGEAGGLSGAPLRDLADRAISRLRPALGSEKTLVGVGGIMSPDDARAKLALGCDLLQLYTGWIYGGPRLVPRIVAALREG